MFGNTCNWAAHSAAIVGTTLENQGIKILKCGLSLNSKKVQSKLVCHIKCHSRDYSDFTCQPGGHNLLGCS